MSKEPEQDAFYVDIDPEKIPKLAGDRIREVMGCDLKAKEDLVPEIGTRWIMGPFTFEVALTNPSQLRFTARLVDVNFKSRSLKVVKSKSIIKRIMGSKND